MLNPRPLPKLAKIFGFLALSLLLLAAPAPRAAAADPSLTTPYSFCPAVGCDDGANPFSSLVSQGNSYYGTAFFGGANGHGAVYVLTRKPKSFTFMQSVLYSFCSVTGCADGSGPVGRVTVEKDGTIFGTTEAGGAKDGGTVFELISNAKKTAYTEQVLYNFCSLANCTDGSTPYSGLITDAKGNLFGMTNEGGANDDGVVFELTPNAEKTGYTEAVLYNFCSLADCADGSQPASDLIMDSKGNLYGTTMQGGAKNGGVVFELKLNPKTQIYSEQVLYSFCSTGGASCTDGATPEYGSLLMDKEGDIFGTTESGGNSNAGVVFELTPNANKTVYTEIVLYRFCSETSCLDGKSPYSGVIQDSAGNLYGTTELGGVSNAGTVYALILDNSFGVYGEAVLYSFCSLSSCTDGSEPLAALLPGPQGTLLGTTNLGGDANKGTVFLLQP